MLPELFLLASLAANPAAWQPGGLPAAALAQPNQHTVPSQRTPAPESGPIVTLPKTIQAEAGDLVEVKVESGAELVTWDSSDGLKLTYPKADSAQKTVYVHSKVGGTYALVASIPNGKETRVAICIVTIGPRPPPVPPKPDPDPVVPGKPVGFAIVVEESSEATANRGAYFSDPALIAILKTKGIGWRVCDKDVIDGTGKPPKDLKGYLDLAKGKKLPQLFLVPKEGGTLLYQGDLPSTPAGLVALLQKFGA